MHDIPTAARETVDKKKRKKKRRNVTDQKELENKNWKESDERKSETEGMENIRNTIKITHLLFTRNTNLLFTSLERKKKTEGERNV